MQRNVLQAMHYVVSTHTNKRWVVNEPKFSSSLFYSILCGFALFMMRTWCYSIDREIESMRIVSLWVSQQLVLVCCSIFTSRTSIYTHEYFPITSKYLRLKVAFNALQLLDKWLKGIQWIDALIQHVLTNPSVQTQIQIASFKSRDTHAIYICEKRCSKSIRKSKYHTLIQSLRCVMDNDNSECAFTLMAFAR